MRASAMLQLIVPLLFLGEVAALASDPAVTPSASPIEALGASTNLAIADPAPRIQFDERIFDFGKVVSGQVVKHDFYFTNIGQRVLVLNNVQPGCHCTTAADWTRSVNPGESGKIPIQFNSSGFSGPVTRYVTVTSNDKAEPLVSLQIKGVAWKPIEFSPQVAALYLKPDAPYGAAIIRVTNSMDKPVWLLPPQSSNPSFGAELRTNWPGREYLVIISNTMVLPPGSARADITLKTTVPDVLPEVDILAWANVPPMISVTPAEMKVPPSPLPTNFSSTVTIINNSTNPLALSEAAVNTTNVQIAIKELRPGHYFTATLTFQQGFSMPSFPLLFTAKTTNPQMASLKVPIVESTARNQPGQRPLPVNRPLPASPGSPSSTKPPPTTGAQ